MSKNQETIISNAIIVAIQKKYGDKVWVHKNVVAKAKLASGFFSSVGLGRGSSDLIVCANGKSIFLEVKCPGKDLEDHQVEWCKMIRLSGGRYECVRCVQDALSVVDKVLRDDYHPTYHG